MLTRSRHLLPKPHPFLSPPSPVIASLSLRTPAARFPQFRALTSSGGVRFTLAASMDAYPGAPSVRNGAAGLEFEEMDKFAEVANMLADAAGAVIRQYFRKSFDVQDKEDLSPVTIADQKAEEAMVSILLEKLPLHAVFGEESGWRCARESADYVWVLDPIDGTKSFITGKPLFGTLIALLHNGEPILGVIDQPVLRERWIGIRGKCTTLNGQEVSTRTCSKLSQAYLYTTSPHLFKGDAEEAFARVRSKVYV